MYFQFKAPLHSAAPAGADVIELRSERERDPQTNTRAHFLVSAESKIILLL